MVYGGNELYANLQNEYQQGLAQLQQRYQQGISQVRQQAYSQNMYQQQDYQPVNTMHVNLVTSVDEIKAKPLTNGNPEYFFLQSADSGNGIFYATYLDNNGNKQIMSYKAFIEALQPVPEYMTKNDMENILSTISTQMNELNIEIQKIKGGVENVPVSKSGKSNATAAEPTATSKS